MGVVGQILPSVCLISNSSESMARKIKILVGRSVHAKVVRTEAQAAVLGAGSAGLLPEVLLSARENRSTAQNGYIIGNTSSKHILKKPKILR